MSKATPGPWEVRKGHPEVFAGPAKENKPHILRGHRHGIASCEEPYDIGDIGKGEAMANARLIAAAPDLLAACEAAMRIESLWVPPQDAGMENPSEGIALDEMRRVIAAAIAKAKGQP